MIVDVAEPKALAAFMDGLDAVISCVGPFLRYGDPAVDAAVAVGVPYVDSTGETPFMKQVYDRHADAAVPVVPACGFDFVPGDLAAALAAELAGGEVDELVVGYLMRGVRVSRGTMRSAVAAMEHVRFAPRRITVDFPQGPRQAITVPWGEELTVPRFLPGVHVQTAFAVSPTLAYGLGAVGPVLPFTAVLTRFATPLLERLVERMPEGPPRETGADRAASGGSTQVVVRATGESGTAGVGVTIGNTYTITATLLVEAAVRVSADGCPTGALTPAQAFEPAAFLDAVSGPLLSWEELPTSSN
jgi:short subunit dehydrogenase-like uncharacterized protein